MRNWQVDRLLQRVPLIIGGDDPLGRALALNPELILLDVEPLVAPWNAPLVHLEHGLSAAQDRTRGSTKVVFVSNSRLQYHPNSPHVWGARKPLKVKVNQYISNPHTVVVGDTLLTDGLLAWRLGVPFIEVATTAASRPWWPRIQAQLARPIRRLLFEERH